jgi:hypothetical protein
MLSWGAHALGLLQNYLFYFFFLKGRQESCRKVLLEGKKQNNKSNFTTSRWEFLLAKETQHMKPRLCPTRKQTKKKPSKQENTKPHRTSQHDRNWNWYKHQEAPLTDCILVVKAIFCCWIDSCIRNATCNGCSSLCSKILLFLSFQMCHQK